MLHLKDGWLCGPRVAAICTLVFLTHRCGGQPQVVGPSEPIVATVGDDITLPCHLSPAVDASDQTVEWARPDLNPRFVYVWRDGVELKSKKHPLYVERTSLHVSKLKHGDISLKLSKVKLSDEGTYRCFIPALNRASSVQLVVGTVSSLIINLMRAENDEEVVLQCEAKGWYPEPEVFWLDGEGNLLSAGPTETVRGPDDLYTVSRRLTVEKSDSFTCRVQQKNIKQTREAHIHVPDDFFSSPCSSAAHIIIISSLSVVLLVVLGAVFVVWTWRQKPNTAANIELPLLLVKKKNKTLQVMSKSIKDLDERKTKLNELLKEVEEEYSDVANVCFLLNNQILDLELKQEQIQNQIQDQSQPEENLIKHTKKDPPETKARLHRKLQGIDRDLKAACYGRTVMRKKKKELENIIEEINKQLEEINSKETQVRP